MAAGAALRVALALLLCASAVQALSGQRAVRTSAVMRAAQGAEEHLRRQLRSRMHHQMMTTVGSGSPPAAGAVAAPAAPAAPVDPDPAGQSRRRAVAVALNAPGTFEVDVSRRAEKTVEITLQMVAAPPPMKIEGKIFGTFATDNEQHAAALPGQTARAAAQSQLSFTFGLRDVFLGVELNVGGGEDGERQVGGMELMGFHFKLGAEINGEMACGGGGGGRNERARAGGWGIPIGAAAALGCANAATARYAHVPARPARPCAPRADCDGQRAGARCAPCAILLVAAAVRCVLRAHGYRPTRTPQRAAPPSDSPSAPRASPQAVCSRWCLSVLPFSFYFSFYYPHPPSLHAAALVSPCLSVANRVQGRTTLVGLPYTETDIATNAQILKACVGGRRHADGVTRG